MASPTVSKRLIHINLKSWQSVTSQNYQISEWVMFCGKFNIDVKSVIFEIRGYVYSDLICARRTRHFEMK